MGYSSSYIFNPNTTGQVIANNTIDNPKFSQIFSGDPLHYHGSQIQIQERLRITCQITDPKLVTQQKQWGLTKHKLGNWQRLAEGKYPIQAPGASGYIENEICELHHNQFYTITANPYHKATIGEYSKLNLCNFGIDITSIPINISEVDLNSFAITEPLIRAEQSRTPSTLADTDYFAWFGTIAFYVFPGVELIRADLNINIINDIYTADSAFSSVVCTIGKPTCEYEFNQFITDQANGGGATGQGRWIYPTKAECESNGLTCIPLVFNGTQGCNITYYSQQGSQG
jgi:hypothetical protein